MKVPDEKTPFFAPEELQIYSLQHAFEFTFYSNKLDLNYCARKKWHFLQLHKEEKKNTSMHAAYSM